MLTGLEIAVSGLSVIVVVYILADVFSYKFYTENKWYWTLLSASFWLGLIATLTGLNMWAWS